MFKLPPGPCAFFDVDDTLIMWSDNGLNDPNNYITIECRGRSGRYLINKHNLEHLIKLSNRGHGIIVWSAGGSDWGESVVKALKIEKYVDAVLTKPTYYIDDVKDTSRFMGKYAYYDYDGKRHGYAPKEEEDESK